MAHSPVQLGRLGPAPLAAARARVPVGYFPFGARVIALMSGHYPNRGLGCKAAEQGVSWAEVKVRAVLDEQ